MQTVFQIVLDFGYSTLVTAHSSIDDLAACAEANYRQHPNIITLAQSASYTQLLARGIIPLKQLFEIRVGQSGTNGTSGGGSYHVLQMAAAMLAAVPVPDRQPVAYELADAFRAIGPQDLPQPVRSSEFFRADFQPPADWQKVFLVAHQAHAPRAIRQGQLFQLDLVPLRNLPTAFYKIADQWWCRGPILWELREMIGYWPLRLCGQL